MSRKPHNKVPNKVATGNLKTKNNGLTKAALLPVKSDGSINKELEIAHFEINPSSYTEEISSNWVPNNIPGNTPIYQWVSGGPRIVTFEALVTKDNSYLLKSKSGGIADLAQSAINVVGDIASSFAGVDLPPISDLYGNKAPGEGNKLSISDYLNYYRSLMYPTYSANHSNLLQSPSLVVLAVGGSFSNGTIGGKISPPKSVGHYLPVWVITNLSIRITKQLPNLQPMEAKVTFTLHEYPIKPIDSDNFMSIGVTAIDPEGLSDYLDFDIGGSVG